MQRWEYKYVYMKTNTNEKYIIENKLNQLGEEGWELVNIVGGVGQNSNNARIHGYLLKRPIK